MTVPELQIVVENTRQLRLDAEAHRRSAVSLAAAGQRAQASSRRLEAMIVDLQATALAATLGQAGEAMALAAVAGRASGGRPQRSRVLGR